MEVHGEVAEREAEAARLEAEMAEVCGVLNAATARLVGLISEDRRRPVAPPTV